MEQRGLPLVLCGVRDARQERRAREEVPQARAFLRQAPGHDLALEAALGLLG